MRVFRHKRGDTFLFLLELFEDDGATPRPLPLVRSQIRQNNALVSELFVDAQPGIGRANLSVDASQTSQWPLGFLFWDIELRNPQTNEVVSSETFQIRVEYDVTRPGAL